VSDKFKEQFCIASWLFGLFLFFYLYLKGEFFLAKEVWIPINENYGLGQPVFEGNLFVKLLVSLTLLFTVVNWYLFSMGLALLTPFFLYSKMKKRKEKRLQKEREEFGYKIVQEARHRQEFHSRREERIESSIELHSTFDAQNINSSEESLEPISYHDVDLKCLVDIADDPFFDQAFLELENNEQHIDTWEKVLTAANGNKKQAVILYLRARVEILRQEALLDNEIEEAKGLEADNEAVKEPRDVSKGFS